MPEKVNLDKSSSKKNTASLNSGNTSIDSKSAVQLNSTENKLSTLQKMADNSPYSQRYAHLTSLANNNIQKQPVSQLSKDSHSLPDNVKHGVESLSGISMDDVKVHYNSAKPAQLNAHAYAQGTDIHIASGQEKHLPHEAWHVVQQKQGRVRPTTMMKAKVPINDDQGLEKEADVMGARALQMKPFSLSDYKTGKSVQRKEIIQRVLETIPEGDEEDDVYPEIDIIPDTENPMREGASEELSSNQKIEDITTVIIALSTNIKKYKEKEAKAAAKKEAKVEKAKNAKEEGLKKQARLAAEAEAKLEIAKKAKGDALEAKKREKAAKKEAKAAAKKEAKVEKAKNAKEEGLKKQARQARLAAEAEATEKATLQAINVAAERAEEARTLVDNCIGENSTVLIASQVASFPAKTVGEVGEITGKESLVESASKGAAVGFIADLVDAFSAVTSYYNSEKKPADLTKLGLNVGKFVTAVVDGVNTAKENALVGEALSTSIGLLPGIGASLMAFKNSVEIYQTYIKIDKINELSTLKDDSDESPFTLKEIELIEQYKTDLDYSLKKIKVDFILNVIEALCMLFPPAAMAVKGLHLALGLYQFACRNYSSYLNNKERKRTERIGEIGVDKLKSDRMDKKSENVSFKEAVADLYNLKRLKNKVPQDADKIREAQDNLDKKLREINDLRLVYAGTNSLITKENLEDFLNVEAEVIKNIAAELKKEEAFKERFYLSFRLSQKKDQIYKEMKLIPTFNFEGVTSENIHNLSPAMHDYFYDKTRESIKVACDRKHISATERLDKIETSLLTKQNNAVINSYMLEKYEGQKVYEATDTPKEKFTKAVKRYKFELKKI